MQHPNIAVVQALYAAFQQGDGEGIAATMSPDIVWHSSGSDESSGTFHGTDEVLGHLFGGAPMDEYDLQVIDTLSSDQRVAVVAHSEVRRGEHRFGGDFVQVLTITDRRVVEVWDYKWDQRAIADFSALTAQVAS